VPSIEISVPQKEEKFQTTTIDDIKIYYHPNIQTKRDYSHIIIKLRKFFFLRWLELEGIKVLRTR
jgi:hypothetical protein